MAKANASLLGRTDAVEVNLFLILLKSSVHVL